MRLRRLVRRPSAQADAARRRRLRHAAATGRGEEPAQPQRGGGGGGGRGGTAQTLGDFQTVQRLDTHDAAADHRLRRVLRLHLQRSGLNYADFKAKADKQEPLPPARAQGRHDHDQRRRRLRRRSDTPDPQRRRHRRGQRSAAEGHLRALRRALRSHRLSARRRAAVADSAEAAPMPVAAPARRATRREPATSSTTAPTTTGRGRCR